jgi:hypothetical protein
MGWNVPDDWNSYYSRCEYCGSRVHASEGGCGCLEDHEQCVVCKNEPTGWYHRDDRREAEGWHHIDRLTRLGEHYVCEQHMVCGCCDTVKDPTKLSWESDADLVLCPKCNEDEDHYCEKDGNLLDHLAKKVAE